MEAGWGKTRGGLDPGAGGTSVGRKARTLPASFCIRDGKLAAHS